MGSSSREGASSLRPRPACLDPQPGDAVPRDHALARAVAGAAVVLFRFDPALVLNLNEAPLLMAVLDLARWHVSPDPHDVPGAGLRGLYEDLRPKVGHHVESIALFSAALAPLVEAELADECSCSDAGDLENGPKLQRCGGCVLRQALDVEARLPWGKP